MPILFSSKHFKGDINYFNIIYIESNSRNKNISVLFPLPEIKLFFSWHWNWPLFIWLLDHLIFCLRFFSIVAAYCNLSLHWCFSTVLGWLSELNLYQKAFVWGTAGKFFDFLAIFACTRFWYLRTVEQQSNEKGFSLPACQEDPSNVQSTIILKEQKGYSDQHQKSLAVFIY